MESARRAVIDPELLPLTGSEIEALNSLLTQLGTWATRLERSYKPGPEGRDVLLGIFQEAGLLAPSLEAGQLDKRLHDLAVLISGAYTTVKDFLEQTAMGTSGVDDHGVVLCTMHEAKGQEYDYVFLTGWDEGLFPLGGGMDTAPEEKEATLQEERRLAYVALTRPRQNAFITFSHRREMRGKWVTTSPSRFLRELPPSLVRFNFLKTKLRAIKPTNDADFRIASPNNYLTRQDTMPFKGAFGVMSRVPLAVAGDPSSKRNRSADGVPMMGWNTSFEPDQGAVREEAEGAELAVSLEGDLREGSCVKTIERKWAMASHLVSLLPVENSRRANLRRFYLGLLASLGYQRCRIPVSMGPEDIQVKPLSRCRTAELGIFAVSRLMEEGPQRPDLGRAGLRLIFRELIRRYGRNAAAAAGLGEGIRPWSRYSAKELSVAILRILQASQQRRRVVKDMHGQNLSE
jgi:hypothetical protein